MVKKFKKKPITNGEMSFEVQCYKYKIEMYSVNIIAIFSSSAMKQYNRLFNYKDDSNGFICDYISDSGELVVFFEDDADISVIAHEALHLTNRIFKWIGHKIDVKNDETSAYLLGYIVKILIKIKEKMV